MSRAPVIQYDTAKLQSQWPRIARSRLDSLKRIAQKSHSKALGLDKTDPPELWRYAVGRIEPPRELAKADAVWAKALAERIRRYVPDFAGDPETYQKFRERLGKPTLRETVLALANRAQDDPKFAKHLRKLLALHDREDPQDQDCNDKEAEILLMNWIEDPPSAEFLIRSFCLFSDLALAKFCYWLRWKKWLPLHQEATEIQRVKKFYQRLGLIPAKPRAIRDLEFKHDELHFIPFKKPLARKH